MEVSKISQALFQPSIVNKIIGPPQISNKIHLNIFFYPLKFIFYRPIQKKKTHTFVLFSLLFILPIFFFCVDEYSVKHNTEVTSSSPATSTSSQCQFDNKALSKDSMPSIESLHTGKPVSGYLYYQFCLVLFFVFFLMTFVSRLVIFRLD